MKTSLTGILMVWLLALSCPGVAQEEGEETRWFSVDALNTGLGQPPDEIERRTPRDAVRSFLTLTQDEDYAAAAHLLNLLDLPPEEQAERGAVLARQLAAVLQRGEWINVSSLSSRQDAMVVESSGKSSRVGQSRRNLELASLDLDGQSYEVRIARYRAGEQEPVWLIAPETITAIPRLYEKYGPSWLEDQIPERFQVSFGKLKLWEWFAIPIFLCLIGAVGWFAHALMGLLASRLPAGLSSVFAQMIRLPLAFIVMSLLTQWLLDYVVSFSGLVTAIFRGLLVIIMAWGVGLIALRLVDTLLIRMTRRLVGEIDDTKSRDERQLLTTLHALRRAVILITVTGVAIYVIAQVSLFETLGVTLLASASVVTVLVGIAGQAVLGNILASFQISLTKPIRIGDLLIFEDQWCYVEGIYYTFIRLRTWDERRLVVPVRYFISKPFQNLSSKNAKLCQTIVLTLHISADVATLREKFKEFAMAEEKVIDHHSLACYVTGQHEATQEISFYLTSPEPMGAWAAEAQVREKLLAFIRDHHPEWWPRSVVVLSEHDIARGDTPEHRRIRRPARVEKIDDASNAESPSDD
ncbi:mechanosensitive ion channel family protein [Halomonas saccharevitans]|uniref:Mechanosensitive ion channel family protein n=1 Tax=Halomonas saccharevitans TaxID=416872 RepID=A0ABU3NK79_9GAMM|nr:mechanosensitive ion channel family protein [Halomonas saccharevitans]MDT8880541.1 mechanosensitive ion channel family protein [Halomonas saccharevitans]